MIILVLYTSYVECCVKYVSAESTTLRADSRQFPRYVDLVHRGTVLEPVGVVGEIFRAKRVTVSYKILEGVVWKIFSTLQILPKIVECVFTYLWQFYCQLKPFFGNLVKYIG